MNKLIITINNFADNLRGFKGILQDSFMRGFCEGDFV
jgi:hypothetical protein